MTTYKVGVYVEYEIEAESKVEASKDVHLAVNGCPCSFPIALAKIKVLSIEGL